MKIEIIKQFSVFMPNRPGALSGLARLFAEKGINLLGIASDVRDDSGMIRIAVEAKAEVSAILSQAGFASVETRLLSIELSNKSGELYRITKILAEGKINITTVYGTAIGGHSCRILIAAEHTEKAKNLLERLCEAEPLAANNHIE